MGAVASPIFRGMVRLMSKFAIDDAHHTPHGASLSPRYCEQPGSTSCTHVVLALHGSPLLARSGFLENGGAVLVSACL